MNTPSHASSPAGASDTSPGGGPPRPGQPFRAGRGAGASSGSGAGAPPSSTAPASYIQPASCSQLLRGGLDTLHLSYYGGISRSWASTLGRLKAAAQSKQAPERDAAQVEIDSRLFRVSDKGSGAFPFVLRGDFLTLRVAGPEAERVPSVQVAIGSELLSQAFVGDVVSAADALACDLGATGGPALVARADLCVDAVPAFPVESIDLRDWVCRARDVYPRYESKRLTSWRLGEGGKIFARFYDKTYEAAKKHKDYVFSVLEAAGWDRTSDVWRMEVQLRREALGRLGVSTVVELLDRVQALWAYFTSDWLQLRLHSETDSNQARWPSHPFWRQLQAYEFAWLSSCRSPLLRRHPLAPSDPALFRLGVGVVSSFMAVHNISDPEEGMARFWNEARSYHDGKGAPGEAGFERQVSERVREKVRRFNLRRNPQASAT